MASIPEVSNLYNNPRGTEEVFNPILKNVCGSLEQIVSNGEASETGFWYDQEEAEWVMLLKGHATLQFSPDSELQLKAGDTLVIPPHSKHRVATVSADAVWLAFHHTEGRSEAP